MINLLINGANMIIKHKKQPQPQQGGFNQQQQQGGWGGQQQGGWGGQQGSWGGQQPQQGGGGWESWGQGTQGQGQGGWGTGVIGEQGKQFWGNNVDGYQWVEQQKKRNDFSIVNPQQQPTVNLNQVIGQQIVFIEPSPVQKKLQELRRQGKVFLDEAFPPNEASLSGQYGADPDWSSIRWKKVTEVMKNPSLFHGKIEPSDIKQGYLGDCYFLAALAAIAERPDRIFNLFLTQDLNQQRYFSVKMLYKGKWMTVDMDEYIPWMGSQPAFSRANQDELWVVLLEKAWAKLYTSYKRIEAGYPEETLHDLTGAPIRQIALKNASFNKEAEWQYLVEASVKQYSMVASSNPGSDTNKSVSGVVQGHAYTVLNAVNLNVQGNIVRLIQLRNPWGKGQFTGKWSDGDQNWNYVSAEEKQRVGFNPVKDDGIFFMPYDNFCAEFRAVTVAEVDDTASYIYKSVKDRACAGVYFGVDILKEDIYSFQVDKTPERIYPEKYQEMFQYPQAIIEIGRIQGNQCQKFQGIRSAKRTSIQKQKLTPGRYVVFVRIAYHKDFEDEYDVNLAVYSPTACNINLASRQEAVIFTGNQAVQWTGQETQNKEPWNKQGNIETVGIQGVGEQGGQQGTQQGAWEGQELNYGGNTQGAQQAWGSQQGAQQGGWGGQQGWRGQQGTQQGGWGGQQQGGWGGQQQGGWGGQGAW